jgi:endonuclease YncB( thermonuclease family)
MTRKAFYRVMIVVAIILLIALNYQFLDKSVGKLIEGYDQDEIFVTRVVDGDTLKTDSGESVRLLGINSPEKGEKYSKEAKEFLESKVLNKKVRLEFLGDRYDKYGRLLAYVYHGEENINIKEVEAGFANYYFYDGRDKYSDDLEDAWNSCVNDEINLCEKSSDKCGGCVSINSGKAIINSCDFNCDVNGWRIKEEGRDYFTFDGKLGAGQKARFDLDFSDSGGTLFLRDGEDKLVDWKIVR